MGKKAKAARRAAAAPEEPRALVPARPKRTLGRVDTDMLMAEMLASSGKPDVSPWAVAVPAPGVVPEGAAIMAQDDALTGLYSFAQSGFYGEGLRWLGYPYLAELAQRPEYRRISETIAREMTRKWIKLTAVGDDDKTKEIELLEAAFKKYHVQDLFRRASELDGFFGRAQIYIDTGANDDPDELKTVLRRNKAKIGKGRLRGLRIIEPIWSYPVGYNADDPLREDYYRPRAWYIRGREVHTSRLLTFVAREVPDLLKPAYAFGGLSMSQMAQPYVENWLRTRQSVSDLLHSFSVSVLSTNMAATFSEQGTTGLINRAKLFNMLRDNRSLMMLDKEQEEFTNVSAPLGTLDHLQAQAQEQMASVSGIPLVVLLGITPSGLNASSDGEVRTFFSYIESQQEQFYTQHINRILEIIQLSVLGDIDPGITFKFNPMWQLDEEKAAAVRKQNADTAVEYVNAGILSPLEERTRIAADEDSLYPSLDVNDLPEPPGDPGMLGDPGEGAGPDAPFDDVDPGGAAPGRQPPPGRAAPGREPPPGRQPPGRQAPGRDAPGRQPPAGRSATGRANVVPFRGASDAYEAGYEHWWHGSDPASPIEITVRLLPPVMAGGGLPDADPDDAPLDPDVAPAEDAFEEAAHPRGQPGNAGEFAKGGASTGGGARAAAGRGARAAVRKGVGAVKRFAEEDYHILHKQLASPGSGPRKRMGEHIASVARSLPKLLVGHLREEKRNAVHTVGALRALGTGNKPSPEQMRGLRAFGTRVLLTSASVAMGDPTGSVGHLAGALGHEVVQHVLIEHALKAFAGMGLLAIRGKKGTEAMDAADEIGAADMALLQRFVEFLAAAARDLDADEAQALAESAEPQAPAADAFTEGDHPRGQPENAGEFAKGGGASGARPAAPAAPPLSKPETMTNQFGEVLHVNPSPQLLRKLAEGNEAVRIVTDGRDIAATNGYDFEHKGMVQLLHQNAHSLGNTKNYTGANRSNALMIGIGDGPGPAYPNRLGDLHVRVSSMETGGMLPPAQWPEGLRRALGPQTAGAADAFKEDDHPRGQPENAGEFASGTGGAAATANPAAPAAQAKPAKAGRGEGGAHHEAVAAALSPTKTVGGKRVLADGKPLPPHIAALAIPPGWAAVRVNADPGAALLVTGRDSKNRPVAIRSKEYSASQSAKKYVRVKALAQVHAQIAARNDAARRDPRTRDVADCFALVMETGIRPGSERDTGAETQGYGATTLVGSHVVSTKQGVALRFVPGKKHGQTIEMPIDNPAIAKMLLKRKAAAGSKGKLFGAVSDKSLLAHTKAMAGNTFKTKDLRTHVGTQTAMRMVQSMPPPADEKARKAAMLSIAKAVATKLGNTPAIAIQSYIAPEVFDGWRMAA